MQRAISFTDVRDVSICSKDRVIITNTNHKWGQSLALARKIYFNLSKKKVSKDFLVFDYCSCLNYIKF